MTTALAAARGTEGAFAAMRRLWRTMRLRLRANPGDGSGRPITIPIPPDCWPIH